MLTKLLDLNKKKSSKNSGNKPNSNKIEFTDDFKFKPIINSKT